jgi:hypothetical protein
MKYKTSISFNEEALRNRIDRHMMEITFEKLDKEIQEYSKDELITLYYASLDYINHIIANKHNREKTYLAKKKLRLERVQND